MLILSPRKIKESSIMPKLKSHSGAKKRFKKTPNGKILSRNAAANHFLQKKSASRKRAYRGLKQNSTEDSKNIKKRLA